MSEHISIQLLERYGQHRLEPPELIALDVHLATCVACRERLREMKPRREALLTLQASLQATDQGALDHMPQAQLTAYAEGRLDEIDRELAESHLEFCPRCAAQARELRDPAQRQAWAPYASTSAPALWTKLAAALDLPSLKERLLTAPLALRVAGATALLALLVIAGALWLRHNADRNEIVIVPTTPSPSTSQPSLSPSPDTQAPAPILLALGDGDHSVTLDAQGNFGGLESLAPTDQQRVKTALTTQKIQTPNALNGLSDSTGAPMGPGSGAAFVLLDPVGKIVAADRPTFRWRPLNGAINYKVTITDPEAGYKEVAASPELRDTTWTVGRPLERGRVYTWQVIARADGREVKAPAQDREAKFKVLEQAQADDLARAEKAYAGRRLTLGILYAQSGLLDEAEREFKALVAANPQSPVARNLLRDLRARRLMR